MNGQDKVARHLSDAQKRRLEQLQGIERLLFRKLAAELLASIEEKDGRIVSRKGYASIAKGIDAIFDAIEERGLQMVGKRLVTDLSASLKLNATHYRVMAGQRTGPFGELMDTVDATMRRRLGIDDDDGIKKKGYLDQLFRTEAARNEVKKMVSKSVSAGVPMRKLIRALKVKVQGSDEAEGVLERHIGTFVLDTYQQADSIMHTTFAKGLGLRYFIYSGGKIETTRKFCADRTGKVFSTEEAKDWEKDKSLPRTKAERDTGVVIDYDPLIDRGRWNCRHRILFITDEMAFARRPELRSKR